GGAITTTISSPVTTEEKIKKKNDVKARSMLLMALPNEHLMTFNQYKDAKILLSAIETRFGGNEATKKTHKTLLKQMYENFSALSTESLDSIFNRLQKINKYNLDTMSIDDLYNNFKIVKQEVKETASSNSSSQNMAFVSSQSINSTNEVHIAYGVSTASTQSSTSSTKLVHKGLEQIHEDDLEEIDLKWLLALLSMRAKMFFQKTGKKITINGSDTTGFNKSNVECYNCHKMGYFAKECRGPRNQDRRNMYQDSSRRTVYVEETPSKAMVAIDRVGFKWSYMAEDEVPTNMTLMAFLDSEVYTNNTCSTTCLKSYETLKTQYDDLKINFNKAEFDLVVYKKGLAFVEEQLVFYKNNETTLYENINVLTSDMLIKDSKINVLKSEIEKIKQEKEGIQFKIEKVDNASRSLDKLLGSQITDKRKNGLGFQSYNVVPPHATLVYNTGRCAPPKTDFSYAGLKEFKQPEFESYKPKSYEIESKNASEDIPNELKEYLDAPLVKDRVLDNKDCSIESPVVVEKKTVVPTIAKVKVVRPKQQEKPVRKTANCNYHQRERVVYRNSYARVNYNYSSKKAHLNAHMNMASRAVLMKISLRPLNTAQSNVKRTHQQRTTLTNKSVSQKVNTAKGKFYTARPKAVNIARPSPIVVNAVRASHVNAVKASSCWVWRTTKPNGASITLKRHNYIDGHPQKVQEDQGYVDSGCSRHMTWNMSYLLDFRKFNGGYVTFRGGANGGRITGKGTIKTGNLDFEDVYFVKELKFNLFSVS
nr:ribonuclease H-like domain-containing protein [Tanacetum cinerariifolium]